MEIELTAQDSERLSLTDSQLLELDRLAALCESHFGGPQDVEWAFTRDCLLLLQSRPITRCGATHLRRTRANGRPILLQFSRHLASHWPREPNRPARTMSSPRRR